MRKLKRELCTCESETQDTMRAPCQAMPSVSYSSIIPVTVLCWHFQLMQMIPEVKQFPWHVQDVLLQEHVLSNGLIKINASFLSVLISLSASCYANLVRVQINSEFILLRKIFQKDHFGTVNWTRIYVFQESYIQYNLIKELRYQSWKSRTFWGIPKWGSFSHTRWLGSGYLLCNIVCL